MSKGMKPWLKWTLIGVAIVVPMGTLIAVAVTMAKKKKDAANSNSGSKNSVVPNSVTPSNATPAQVKMVETAAQSGAVLTPNEQAILATQGKGDGPVRTGGVKAGEGKGDANAQAATSGRG